ncbi:MerR family transcriptional regulator, partial [Streptomyces sp. NPDC059835]|uniref:MerR family transcriptional regulator n=1 Tax=Streptomyces sp. NPDC059835 TaxID=3346967 RepID=UPI0036680BB9
LQAGPSRVPPTDRSPAGYRLYGPDALARLALVRTLRDLGLDLATVRRVLDREASIPEVTEARARALDVQIRTLRLRRAVLRAVARRGPTTMEMDLMHRLATLSRIERHRLVSAFIDEAFEGLDTNPEFVALMRSAMPELPDDPAPEQVEAWVELAGEDAVAVQDSIDRAMRERVGEAAAVGLLPASSTWVSLAEALGGLYADAFRRADAGGLRRWLLARLRSTADPGAERYWRLPATVNGWPASAALATVHPWFTAVSAGSGAGMRGTRSGSSHHGGALTAVLAR